MFTRFFIKIINAILYVFTIHRNRIMHKTTIILSFIVILTLSLSYADNKTFSELSKSLLDQSEDITRGDINRLIRKSENCKIKLITVVYSTNNGKEKIITVIPYSYMFFIKSVQKRLRKTLQAVTNNCR